MGKIREHYDLEFKQTIVDLINNSSKEMKEVCREYTIKEATVCNWLRDSKASNGAFKSSEKILKKKLKEAEMERYILKKAVCIFSTRDR